MASDTALTGSSSTAVRQAIDKPGVSSHSLRHRRSAGLPRGFFAMPSLDPTATLSGTSRQTAGGACPRHLGHAHAGAEVLASNRGERMAATLLTVAAGCSQLDPFFQNLSNECVTPLLRQSDLRRREDKWRDR